MKIIYLTKAGDDVISHCSCGDGRMTFPAQADCPWCGCGWLFSCISCRKAFTFAKGIELETTWEELAREDMANMSGEAPSVEEIQQWVEAMKEILADIRVGGRYVIIDGTVFPADSKNVEFDGWHAHHHFETLPQFEALDDRTVLEESLDNRGYWMTNALSEED